jgi:16S rRNA (cytosine967-C5)-methyltransferase
MTKPDSQSGASPSRAAPVAPARVCAYAVVRRVFEQEAWADRALHGEARRLGLDARDLALATQLSFGTVQRVATLDHVISQLTERSPAKLDKPVLAALRLGVFQLTFLDRVPAHAAVGESVELAKADAPRGAGLVNAVLRRAAREARAMVAALPDCTPAQAALAHSHPEWIAALWFETLGAPGARALMAANNEPAEPALRANTLKIAPADLAAALPVPSHPAADLPEGLVLEAPLDVFSTRAWQDGLLMPQSRAAMTVARVLDPRPGERVLDLCAAPGGKTTHLAALMRNEGEIVAVEKHPGRADALRRTAARLEARIVAVQTKDAADRHADGFDRVLVDPPCSDLGTLASRPDARWRKAGRPQALAGLQASILAAGAAAVRPGGTLVYSTCTISPAENERVVVAFLSQHEDFSADDLSIELPVWKHPTMPQYLQTFPHRDDTDGFFIARMTRR